jgi:flavin reductase (DIM6/NTAB) family NADH-FMN oxidoreductase RutF
MRIDPPKLNQQDASHLLMDIVIPRPIAWVSTVNASGQSNLAPFSAYGVVSTIPMCVGFSAMTNRDGKKKDTLRNIEATKEFVVNMVTDELMDVMNVTCAPYPPEVSEFDKAHLAAVRADIVKAPLVALSPVSMECRLVQIIEFGKLPTVSSFIIGEVLRVHVKDSYWDKQKNRVTGLRAVGRLGGDQDLYCHGKDAFELKRPTL